MNKLMVFMLMIWVFGQSFSWMLDGESGIAATVLSASLVKSATTATVTSTTGFPSAGRLFVNNEEIEYTGTTSTTFTGLTRGVNGTSDVSHASGSQALTEVSDAINRGAGFQVAKTQGAIGTLKFAVEQAGVLVSTVWKILAWDYSWLEGNALWIKYYLLYPLSFGTAVSVILAYMGARRGIFV